MDELIEQLLQRMQQEGLISYRRIGQPGEGEAGDGPPGEVRFEVTERSLDFLGYKTLRDFLGSLGKSSFGRHDTRDMATGIESAALHVPTNSATLSISISPPPSALRSPATASSSRSNSNQKDLQVHQCEYQSSCATVVMLDCSHSMILYGEDRFTPPNACRHGALPSHPHPISRRLNLARPLSRLRRTSPHRHASPRQGRPALHQHLRRPSPRPAHPRRPAQRHEADCHDHRRQALRTHPPRRTHLPQRLRP